MHAPAISSIVSFLTSSLVPFYDPTFIHAIRLYLHMSLPGHFASSSELSLSLNNAPPRFLAKVPIAFAQWMFLLGDQPIRILASSIDVKAVFPNRNATLWRKDVAEDIHERDVVSIAQETTTITKPTPAAVYRAPIRVPSVPIRRQDTIPEDESSSSSASDTDSDDGYFSEDSMTSVSSTRSDHSVSKPEPRVQPVLARASPATTYLYQGGKTNVVTGGVMLGGGGKTGVPIAAKQSISSLSPLSQNKPITPAMRTALPKARRVFLGPDSSSNWRRRD